MARQSHNFQWIGFSPEQIALLDRLDFYGNNAWPRTSQLEWRMPILLKECDEVTMTIEEIKAALGSIGYDNHALHQLDRWDSKRTMGKFGR